MGFLNSCCWCSMFTGLSKARVHVHDLTHTARSWRAILRCEEAALRCSEQGVIFQNQGRWEVKTRQQWWNGRLGSQQEFKAIEGKQCSSTILSIAVLHQNAAGCRWKQLKDVLHDNQKRVPQEESHGVTAAFFHAQVVEKWFLLLLRTGTITNHHLSTYL